MPQRGNFSGSFKSGVSSAATNRSGKSAMHPTMRMTWKRALKIERIARLSADPAGYSNEQIANMLGCDKQTIVLIRQTPEYHAKMIEVASGVVSQYDAQLREDVENMRDELRAMVPSSMMVIRNALAGSYGNQIRFKAAQEVLDREGTNAKVSKSSVTVKSNTDLNVKGEVVTNLMALLASAPVTTNGEIVAGAPAPLEFTKRASDTKSEALNNPEKTKEILAALDLSEAKPN